MFASSGRNDRLANSQNVLLVDRGLEARLELVQPLLCRESALHWVLNFTLRIRAIGLRSRYPVTSSRKSEVRQLLIRRWAGLLAIRSAATRCVRRSRMHVS